MKLGKMNWKAYAKQAYQRGYERGRLMRDGWIPARDPPGKTKEYECVVISIQNGRLVANVAVLRYSAGLMGSGWRNYETFDDYPAVLFWREMPQLPELTYENLKESGFLEGVVKVDG